MKSASTAFNGKQLAKELDNVGKTIKNTTDKIELEKKKLFELKEAFEKATNPTKKNAIEKQMLQAEASIIKLENKLNGLKDKQVNLKVKMDGLNGLDGEFKSAEMSATKSLDNIEKKAKQTGRDIKNNLSNIDIGKGISNIGESISGVGDKLTTRVTLPILGLGAAAAKIGMDFDSGMSRVKAISGATREEFTKLHDQALQLGADTAFSAKQAAEGMENLASAGFSTEEIMQAMPGMLDLAASSGEDLSNSSDIAASTLRGFGLEADKAGHVADVLAKNAAATNAAVGDTGEALKFIAPAAHAAGISLEETTAAIGILANSGIKGTMAGTTLRSILTRLASPAKEAADAMELIGFKAFDARGKMLPLSGIINNLTKSLKGKTDQQKQDYIATIFGQEAMSGLLTLVDAGSGQLDDLTTSYKNADGAAKDMAKTMQDNSKSAIEQMTGSLETTAIKLEEDFAPVIIQICNEIQNLANAFSDLSPEQQEFYAKTLLAIAAGGPALKLVGGLTSGIGGLIGGVSKLAALLTPVAAVTTEVGATTAASTGGIAAFGGSLATIAPVAIPVIAALAALGVGAAAVATANDQMGDKLTRTTDDMTEWQKAINGMTGYTFKSKKELQDLGIEYKEFGSNISDNFKKKVEESTDTLHKFELFLKTINLDGIITDSESSDFNNQINKMVNDAISTINSKKAESSKSLSDLFKLDDNAIDATEQKVLDTISKGYDNQISQENQLKTEILAIKQKAVNEKRALNEQEIKDVQDKTNKIKEIELNSVGGTAEEKAYSKNEFGARVETVSATDASKLLQDKRKALDEENIKIKASYDTQIDMLKANLSTADGENAAAIQAEIDKFTKLRDDKTKLKSEEWEEYINILRQKNPEALALINTFNGEELTKGDLIAQQKLTTMKQTYDGLSNIVKSGTYELENTQTKSMETVTVTVDEGTGKITGAYSSTSGQVAGYTEQMAKDNAELGRSHAKLAAECQLAMNNLSGSHINASGEIRNSSGQIVGSLKDIVTENGHVVSGIYDLNGTPIKIETNADGTISNLTDVIEKISQIPKGTQTDIKINGEEINTIDKAKQKIDEISASNPETTIKINGEETANAEEAKAKLDEITKSNPNAKIVIESSEADSKVDTTTKKVDDLNGKKADATVTVDVGKSLTLLDDIKNLFNWITGRKATATVDVNANTGDATPRYTGTSGGSDGLITKDEHGYEFTTGENELYYLGAGTGILDHGSSVNAMKKDVSNAVDSRFGVVVNKLLSAMSSQNNLLGNISSNTKESAKNGIQLNEKLANGVINQMNSTTGSFTGLEQQIRQAQYAVDNANIMSIDNNEAYAKAKAELDRLNNLTSNERKALGDDEYQRQKDYAEKAVETAKQAAELEIEVAKNTAKKKQEIAEQNKNALAKIAEATTTAIKNQLTKEKEAAEKVINDELSNMEKSYNKKVEALENRTKSKSDKLDKQIAELEQQSTDDSRYKERTDANNNINVLKTKMANTASEADKRAIALEIKDAQNELKEKEDAWDIEDQKAALEKEKSLLSEKEDNEKKSLEKEYTRQKEAKQKELKNVDAYYDKLLETDSINAQARYRILNDSQQDLVNLLNSYAPKWQDSGQSLADSLINGLNSQQTSTEDAVRNLISIRSSRSSSSDSTTGYASGTSYNPYAGLYNVDENNKFEISSSDDAVAYVSKGAAIKNHMQSEQFIKSEIAKQVGLMKSAVMQSQMDMARSLGGLIAKATTNNTKTEIYQPQLNIQEYHQHTNMDAEQLADEFNVMAYKQKKS
ncbi:phage tail tape measure protein [Clostridium sp. 2-1]|nr:phage tail tape measure protein [Clostridium beijerinckii]MBN7581145.1 phage tail tape measure protein [Clostridium beijerinckii]MBN7585743.1 phage tail tape measure protein [Clostridium beijerinckii]MBO0521532.1 phage tail tape measure protein [Clostridium beijerinckii]POO91030.1 phage tail tape measure protein [Clostridium sp. 2-1]